MKLLPSLLLSKLNTDAKLPPEVKEVLEVAALLDTNEFNIFKLAFKHWFGHSVHDEKLEHSFSNYMFNEIVPHWVRHFTREVLRNQLIDDLDPATYGLSEPTPSPRTLFWGRVYTSAIALIILLLFVITLGPEELFGITKSCYFLPCY